MNIASGQEFDEEYMDPSDESHYDTPIPEVEDENNFTLGDQNTDDLNNVGEETFREGIQGLDDFKSKSKESNKEFEAESGFSSEETSNIENIFDQRNKKYIKAYSVEVAKVKKLVEEASIGPIQRAFEMISCGAYVATPRTISDEEALQKVLDKQVIESEEIFNFQKDEYFKHKRVYEGLIQERVNNEKSMNKVCDLYKTGELKLEVLGTKLTEQLRLRDELLLKRETLENPSEIDGVIQESEKRIDYLNQEIDDVALHHSKNEDNLTSLALDNQMYESNLSKAEGIMKQAKKDYIEARETYKIQRHLKSDEQSQNALISYLKQTQINRGKLNSMQEGIRIDNETTDDIFKQGMGNGNPYQKLETLVGNTDVIKQCNRDNSSIDSKLVQYALNKRYKR